MLRLVEDAPFVFTPAVYYPRRRYLEAPRRPVGATTALPPRFPPLLAPGSPFALGPF